MTDVAIGVVEGKVVAKWNEPTTQIVFDAQNAFQIGEALARAAHEARFGEKVPSDMSYLQQQIKARVTEELRDKLVTRVAHIIRSTQERKRTPGFVAMSAVDAVLREVT